MDWTSVFVEDGTEDLVRPHQMDQKATAPRLTRLVSKLYHHLEKDETVNDSTLNMENRLLEIGEQECYESSYSLQALYYLSINFVMGVGCLGIPYAFARAGFILCSSILLTVTLCSYMTVMWVAETGDRFEKQNRAANDSTSGPTSELSPLLRKRAPPPKSLIEEGRYEVIDLVNFYLGPFQKIVYQISLMSLMYIGLLAYSQVFCGALGALIWGATVPESAWTVLPQITFGLMVIPLSCMELDEQVAIQSIMAHVRFVAIFVMVLGSMAALSIDGSKSNSTHPPYWAIEEPDGCQMSYTACFSGFGVAFSTCLFSQLFQHSIPGLLRPLKEQPEKLKKVPQTLAASLLTTSSFYLLLGMIAASYFGVETRSSINLNFAHFTFGLDPVHTSSLLISSLRFASGIVVVFPALDTISVFPLIANTLGNNLFAAAGPEHVKWLGKRIVWYQSWRAGNRSDSLEPYHQLPFDDRRKVLEKAGRIASIFWRLVSSLPPLLGSLVATDLSFSFLLAGVAGIYVAFFAPSLLQLVSSTQLKDQTIYAGWYSRTAYCYTVLGVATLSLGVVIMQIRDALSTGNEGLFDDES